MPYYVFHVRPAAPPDRRAECASFGEASALTRSLRAALPPGSAERIRMMFAESEQQARDLMSRPRPAGPSGDD